MVSILGRKKREEELEKELIELKERYGLLERRIEEALEKTERVERGARLLTEAVYKIITYLKDLEWPKDEKPAKVEVARQPVVKQNVVEYLTETEQKILEEVEKKGVITASECCTLVGRTEEHVSRLLKKLTEKGLLTRDRKGKTFYYRLAEK
ncbi:MAG: BlaI/MecI/CopY family transcriptional regulator [Candidatus Brockarchaeota archaeon]|nr:BlaI/MecI/CopY family transcriptional regulator [Candidatus Brockarchaeota archaeon]